MKLTLTKAGKDKVYDVDFVATHAEPGKLTIKVRGTSKTMVIDSKDWDKILLEQE